MFLPETAQRISFAENSDGNFTKAVIDIEPYSPAERFNLLMNQIPYGNTRHVWLHGEGINVHLSPMRLEVLRKAEPDDKRQFMQRIVDQTHTVNEMVIEDVIPQERNPIPNFAVIYQRAS